MPEKTVNTSFSRRRFLQFMGAGAALGMGAAATSCEDEPVAPRSGAYPHLPPSTKDEVVLVKGLTYEVLIRWGDPINAAGERFGYNNDYLAWVPTPSKRDDELLLWVNHETASPYFVGGYRGGKRTREQVDAEQLATGGSILKVRRGQPGADGRWRVVADDPLNRRITAKTVIPFAPTATEILGARSAVGTLANCAGGVTPWQTFLTCEENYYKQYGEVSFKGGERKFSDKKSKYHWNRFFDCPPEHYGWVVEVDPVSGACKKLTGLGRFCHESATAISAADGRCVVYTGDDSEGECLYKFIADKPGQLETGTLYVADLDAKRWLPLDREQHPELRARFANHLDLMVRTREAAHLVGGTPLDRPEDIEVAADGSVFVTLTNNDKAKNYHGSLMRIRERGGDPTGTAFEWDTFLTGGSENGFSSPDNMAFDPKGNLWFTCDVSESSLNQGRYSDFGNNGLYFVPMHGAGAGRPFRLAAAPVDAEFTGPCFSPDGRTLFLAVQHPGSLSAGEGRLTSHWPDGGESVPRPSVICIQGPLLDRLMA